MPKSVLKTVLLPYYHRLFERAAAWYAGIDLYRNHFDLLIAYSVIPFDSIGRWHWRAGRYNHFRLVKVAFFLAVITTNLSRYVVLIFWGENDTVWRYFFHMVASQTNHLFLYLSFIFEISTPVVIYICIVFFLLRSDRSFSSNQEFSDKNKLNLQRLIKFKLNLAQRRTAIARDVLAVQLGDAGLLTRAAVFASFRRLFADLFLITDLNQ
ncbi:hypothetical protein TYRP_016748 [Tyrophagus putrescentiae]|nr:hypothetical protein TYRP_016748 [Tyrophagus putrescentiae]